jgi:hypothetical protein
MDARSRIVRLARALSLACAVAGGAARTPAADLGTVPGSTAPTTGEARSWNFRVYLNQDPIGYHRFALSAHGELRELQSVAHYLVKILFINAYHYDHRARESWSGNCLHRLESSSDDDGTAYSVHAAADEQGLEVDAPRGHYTVAGCAMTFAYWNPLMLQQSHLINPETGEDVAVTITSAGEEPITVRGAAVRANRYHLHSDKLEIDLWYSAAGEWLALESPQQKGRRLRYVLE